VFYTPKSVRWDEIEEVEYGGYFIKFTIINQKIVVFKIPTKKWDIIHEIRQAIEEHYG